MKIAGGSSIQGWSHSPQRRLAIALAAVAVLILVAGTQLKIGPSTTPVPSEAAAFGRAARSQGPRELATELYTRASRFAANLTWIPERRASAFAWRTSRTLLTNTADGGFPVELVDRPGSQSEPPAIYRGNLDDGTWVVLAGRTAEGAIIWTAGMYGGTAQSQCGGFSFRELLIGTVLSDAYAGAAVLDRDGRLVGMAVRCGGRIALMPADEISRALSARRAALNEFGYRAELMDARQREYFRNAGASLVTAVADGSAADRAGLQPGDVITGIDPEDGKLTVLRNRRRFDIQLYSRPMETRGMVLAPESVGARVVDVAAGSAAAQAGLRPGDLIVNAGRTDSTAPAGVIRALAAPGPVFTVYRRGVLRQGVMIP